LFLRFCYGLFCLRGSSVDAIFVNTKKRKLTKTNVSKLYKWLKNSPAIVRTPGTGVFIEENIPRTAVIYSKVAHCLPNTIVIVNIKMYDIPVIPDDQVLTIKSYGKGIYHMKIRVGFVQKKGKLDLQEIVETNDQLEIDRSHPKIAFFVSREMLVNRLRRRFWCSFRTFLYNVQARVASPAGSSTVDFPEPSLVELYAHIAINSPSKNPRNWFVKFWNK